MRLREGGGLSRFSGTERELQNRATELGRVNGCGNSKKARELT